MAQFIYKGQTKKGEDVEETVEAPDRYAVYDIAREKGHTVTTITAAKKFSFKSLLKTDKIDAVLSRVTDDDLVMLSRNLSAMLGAGLSLSRALSVAERQTQNPKLSQTLGSVRTEVNSGKEFNEALSKFPKVFSRLYIAMIRAGEQSGGLAEALTTIAIQTERSSNLKKKIRGAMIYPSIVIGVMIVIGILMMMYVVPTLTTTFRELNVDLPTSTQAIIFVSDFLSQRTVLALAVIVGVIAGAIGLYRTRSGRRAFEWGILHMPIIKGLVKETNAARTARTLSSLLSAGVDVVGALSITEDVVQNSYYKAVVRDAAVRVEKGKPLSESFAQNEHLYPVIVGEMVAVGEETGQISNMLIELANFYESEVERKTKDLSTIIEPFLMVIIGGVVGFFALAMISPIYSVTQSI